MQVTKKPFLVSTWAIESLVSSTLVNAFQVVIRLVFPIVDQIRNQIQTDQIQSRIQIDVDVIPNLSQNPMRSNAYAYVSCVFQFQSATLVILEYL